MKSAQKNPASPRQVYRNAGQFLSCTDCPTGNLVGNLLTEKLFAEEYIYQNALLKLIILKWLKYRFPNYPNELICFFQTGIMYCNLAKKVMDISFWCCNGLFVPFLYSFILFQCEGTVSLDFRF